MSEQPWPKATSGNSMHDVVLKNFFRDGHYSPTHARCSDEINARRLRGMETYGVPLQAFNGRDAIHDLTEELADALCYAEQVQAEGFGLSDSIISWIASAMEEVVRLELRLEHQGKPKWPSRPAVDREPLSAEVGEGRNMAGAEPEPGPGPSKVDPRDLRLVREIIGDLLSSSEELSALLEEIETGLGKTERVNLNRFSDANSVEELIAQVVDLCSVTTSWGEGSEVPPGKFQEDTAKRIIEEAASRLKEIIKK